MRLDQYQQLVYNIILKHQHPITGLFPAKSDDQHAWVRDNVYTVLAVWGLSMASKKAADADEERAKTYELEQSCVKLMRGLLTSMMHQKDKVEAFKISQNPLDALHAKYSVLTGLTIVGDKDWGHLQIDAISLYLLILAQMTASGLQIVFSLDEVAFIQNLVFYIESAYCIPDYGVWERGDKSNHGLPELNASSIGMAKAALEAMNELDLFGSRGGAASVIHVLSDEVQKCQAVLQSMLPRESNSKEVDSGLLAIISFPAFAVDDLQLIETTRKTIISKLKGKYGCKRFLRDGYKTAKEDPNRLHYDPHELRIFENIECEWPLFFCYLLIDNCFQGNEDMIKYYDDLLHQITVPSQELIDLVPEMYAVPIDKVDDEARSPGSQNRVVVGRCPFMWAQSLYILGKLLQDGYLAIGELDPLNRRLCSQKKPDVVVQVVILAGNNEIREQLLNYDIHVQTISDAEPIVVQPARVLSHLYTFLGRNKKMALSGRRSRHVGILSTSKLYTLNEKIFAFTPQTLDLEQYYISNDAELLANNIMMDLAFLAMHWKHILGRPVYTIIASENILDHGKIPLAMITTIKKLKSGYINGTRVTLGNLTDFSSTSCITNLSFLRSEEDGYPNKLNPQVEQYLDNILTPQSGSKLLSPISSNRVHKPIQRKMSVRGAVKKTRSNISVDDVSGYETASRNQVLPIHTPKIKITSDSHYANEETEELLNMLMESNLEEQGDILQYLVDTKGQDFDTGMVENGKQVIIKDLLKALYEKACHQKMWGLVRHTAGMLGKRVEDLTKAVTDLLVRQKQVTVGIPPSHEHTIMAPLPENELIQIIHDAYGDNESTAMLTQELLVYLAMFIRTEPHLFLEMLRLRIGSIVQVMASELSRTLCCEGQEATEHLMNLSPYEMKNLLYHIMSGKEFAISRVGGGNFSIISGKSSHLSKKSQICNILNNTRQLDVISDLDSDRQGQWLRRRRLDGALNRVPRDFYAKVWGVLERCEGLGIEGRLMPHNLTQEMTPNELKFALALESVLNFIPQPEYRQLVVEALMTLALISESGNVKSLGGVITLEELVYTANKIFLEDQMEINGDATLCCAKPDSEKISAPDGSLICGGAMYICQSFYDSAPSGSFGTITYFMRAVASLLRIEKANEMIQCVVN